MKRFLLCVMLFGALSAQAQTSVEQEQAAQIAQLQQEVAALQEKGKTWDKITKALPKISGYAQVRYDYNDGNGSSTFQLRRVRMTFDGNISPKMDYKLQLELTSPKIVDAYFSYKPMAGLKLRAGQFKVPFSIENTEYGPTKLELIDYPMAITYLVGNSDAANKKDGANGRDIGVKLYGDLFNKVVSYDLGVFNGAGINCKDNNKSKDVAARLFVRPVDGLLISGSFLWSEGGANYITRNRWAAGICYDKGAWMARSEWIGGKTDEVKSDGMYITAGYRFCKAWMAIARYDSFCFDDEARDAMTQENYTLGVAWQPIKHFKLQLNYVYEDCISGKGHNNVMQVQASAMF